MKRSFSLFCALGCAFLFFSCDNPSNTSDSTGTPAAGNTEPVTLKVWESEDVNKEFMLWAFDEYKKTHPTVSFVFEPVSHVDTRSKIEGDGPAGIGADVFVAPHDHLLGLISGGHVLEHAALATQAAIISPAVNASSAGGKMYGYPLAIETYALFYNKDIVSTPPETWEQVLAFANTFNNASEGKYALVWETGNAYFNFFFLSGFGVELFGPEGMDSTKHNLNSNEAIAGMTYFKSLRSSLLDLPASTLTDEYVNQSFAEGKAAMIISGPWKIKDFSNAGLYFGIAPLPKFPGKTQPPASFSGVRLAFVSAYSKNPVAAKAFAEFLCSKDIQQKRYEMTNQIPVRTDVTIADPLIAGVFDQTRTAVKMPSIPAMGTYWKQMGAALPAIWDGADVKTELDKVATAF